MNEFPIRILHVVGAMDRAGAESMIMSLYRDIDRSKFQFDFLEFDPEESDFTAEIAKLGGRVLKSQWSQAPTRFRATQKALINLMRSEGPFAAVHSHILFGNGAVMKAAKVAGVPIRIAHSHNTSDSATGLIGRGYQSVARWLIRRHSTAQLACSLDAGRYLFGDEFSGSVIPNSVDLERFRPPAMITTERAPQLGQTTSLVSVARFEPVKNHMFLVELAEELRSRGLEFVIKFVGKGSLEVELRETIMKRDLASYIEMLGLRLDVEDILRESDALLMPSLWEGLPVALVEAQASGLPCLVSDAVARDADLGLGLVRFLPIEEVSVWADAIEAGFPQKPTHEEVIVALEDRGYTVASSLERLLPFYAPASRRDVS